MEEGSHYDIALWLTHVTEDDCELILRTNNGRAFYCHLDPSQFCRSPKITEQYFKCINLFRSGDEEQDDFYIEDACDWLSGSFEPLVNELAPSTLTLPGNRSPTLSDYLFPPYFVCTLEATDEELKTKRLDTQYHGWSSPIILADKQDLSDLEQWTRLYQASDVELCYDRRQDVLIKPPEQVVVGCNDDSDDSARVICFYKPFNLSFGPQHEKNELMTLKKITEAPLRPPPEARVCCLHGVVQAEKGLAGMLFSWIDKKGVLSKGLAEESTVELRRR
ncbi:hypothetical protein HD806DRAFT_492405 [Xylariaceae sp. AK1471]|nr:hypothetical protein HD806DRAFT_492405 [Xylariaceae sp. AK1471]